MNYKEYRGFKDTIDLNKFIRLDCMNIYKSLELVKDKDVADYLTKHYYIDNILYDNLIQNFAVKTGFGYMNQHTMQVTKNGVVYTLKTILNKVKELDKELVIPNDVYPVYKQLCHELDLPYLTYDTYFGNDVLNNGQTIKDSVILITYPNKPTSNEVREEVLSNLLENNNILIFDSVYLRERDEVLEKMSKEKNVILLHSLSKTFMEVKKVGFVIDNTDLDIQYELLSEEEKQFYNTILNQHNTNEILKRLITEVWKSKGLFPKEILENIYPCSCDYNYFRKVKGSYYEQLEKDVLTIPPSIYDVIESENKESFLISPLLLISNQLKTIKNHLK